MSYKELFLDPMADALDERIASVRARLAGESGPSPVDVAGELLEEGFGSVYVLMGLMDIFGIGLVDAKGHLHHAKVRRDGCSCP